MLDAMARDTRQRMLETTARLLQHRGYYGTSLNDILERSAAPRGSLYFHFPGGKQELAAAAIDVEGARWRERVSEVVERSGGDLAAAVLAVGELLASDLEASDFRDGCPAATVALEVSAESEPLRLRCAALYGDWERLVAGALIDAGVAAPIAATTARFALCAFEGALLIARVKRSAAPVRELAAVLAMQVKALGAVSGNPDTDRSAGHD